MTTFELLTEALLQEVKYCNKQPVTPWKDADGYPMEIAQAIYMATNQVIKEDVSFQEVARRFRFIPAAERLVAGWDDCPDVELGAFFSCYAEDKDTIILPSPLRFPDSELFYRVMFHEMIHATGSKKRLARPSMKDCREFDDPAYLLEELVAELGSVFLCSAAGIAEASMGTSIPYLAHYFIHLDQKRESFMEAATLANEAAHFILGRDLKASAMPVLLSPEKING